MWYLGERDLSGSAQQIVLPIQGGGNPGTEHSGQPEGFEGSAPIRSESTATHAAQPRKPKRSGPDAHHSCEMAQPVAASKAGTNIVTVTSRRRIPSTEGQGHTQTIIGAEQHQKRRHDNRLLWGLF